MAIALLRSVVDLHARGLVDRELLADEDGGRDDQPDPERPQDDHNRFTSFPFSTAAEAVAE